VFRNSIVTSRIFYLAVAWALALTICSCSSTKVANVAPPLMPPVGEVASYTVRLDVSAGKCILSYDGPNKGQVDTGLLAPCEFLRTPVGEINARELKNTKQNGDSGYSVILVIGGPPSNYTGAGTSLFADTELAAKSIGMDEKRGMRPSTSVGWLRIASRSPV